MYACTGRYRISMGVNREDHRGGHRGGRAGRPAVGEVAGSALSPGRSELFHLSSRPTQLRRTHPMLLASQIDPRYVGSNHGQPFGFLIVVRLIIGFLTILRHPAIRLPNTTARSADTRILA